MDRASFDLLFRPEILVGVSCQAYAVPANARPDVQPYNRIAANSSLFPSLAAKTDGGSRGVGFLRLFSRLKCAGQDACSEKSNLFFRPVINLVIPIALVAAVVRREGIFTVLRRCLRLVQWLAHVVNHMSGVTQSVGNIDHQTGNSIRESGNLTQLCIGRTDHV